MLPSICDYHANSSGPVWRLEKYVVRILYPKCIRTILKEQPPHTGSRCQHLSPPFFPLWKNWWHRVCQPKLTSQHEYFICWITWLARALLRESSSHNTKAFRLWGGDKSLTCTKIPEKNSKSRYNWRDIWKSFCGIMFHF